MPVKWTYEVAGVLFAASSKRGTLVSVDDEVLWPNKVPTWNRLACIDSALSESLHNGACYHEELHALTKYLDHLVLVFVRILLAALYQVFPEPCTSAGTPYFVICEYILLARRKLVRFLWLFRIQARRYSHRSYSVQGIEPKHLIVAEAKVLAGGIRHLSRGY
jgi:hypothetical protein